MATSNRPQTPDDVVEKVLRRAEVAKMARKLQDRLALASYKAQHGLDNLSFNLVEAHLDKTMKQKRPVSSVGTSSDTSSSSSGRHLFSSTFGSSPNTAPFFSDDIQGSGGGYKKRRLQQPTFSQPPLSSSPRKRVRAHSTALPVFESSRTSWKTTHNLPESSPVYRNQRDHYQGSHQAGLSFVSEISTVTDSPSFGHVSDGDSPTLPRHSFSLNSSTFKSSPPRTPPPTRSRSLRQRKGNAAGEEGADLLLYLATSPSPANPTAKSRPPIPSTPPSKINALPSSMMLTPGGGGYLGGFNTPGQQFNFADFVNITPSPAQGAFGNRTPGPGKTPLAAREARRKLNFDSLVPPKEAGLGMELGGELVNPGVGPLGGINTPGSQFNFADFVNITPGPPQGFFGNRTPGPVNTPVTAKEAKRKLNLDSLAPPGSQNVSIGESGSVSKEAGLGMELGGELVS